MRSQRPHGDTTGLQLESRGGCEGAPAHTARARAGEEHVACQRVSEQAQQSSSATDLDGTPGVALVTGAGSGIGLATARRLAASGLTVAAADRDGAAARHAATQDERIFDFTVDVTDARGVATLARDVTERCGAPNVLVNCAGWDETHPFAGTDRPFWERVLAINLLGVIAVTHAFLAAMVQRGGGRIVNVASDAGRVGSSGEAVYAGAKGGVIAFTKSLAREHARHGITANAVCPGPTDTPLFRAQPEHLQEALLKAVPMRRLGTPDDVASAIAFFASEDAGFVTGQVLSVSGGLTMAG
jgi:2-hydroxycyclohexanecarboxyl-CoA dehydrogenase